MPDLSPSNENRSMHLCCVLGGILMSEFYADRHQAATNFGPDTSSGFNTNAAPESNLSKLFRDNRRHGPAGK